MQGLGSRVHGGTCPSHKSARFGFELRTETRRERGRSAAPRGITPSVLGRGLC